MHGISSQFPRDSILFPLLETQWDTLYSIFDSVRNSFVRKRSENSKTLWEIALESLSNAMNYSWYFYS